MVEPCWREDFIHYLKNKKLFSKFLYFTHQSPGVIWEKRKPIKLISGEEIPFDDYWNYPYLDLSDVPVFQWQGGHSLAGIKSPLLYTTILILITIILFYLSFLSFLKYDVR